VWVLALQDPGSKKMGLRDVVDGLFPLIPLHPRNVGEVKMIKKVFLLCLLSLFITAFSFQTAMAYDANWKANQQKLYDQMKLKPGDVIDSSNADLVKDFVPASVFAWIKKGEFVLKLGEMKYDYSHEKSWDEATELNKGKFGLGVNKEVVEKATGQYPMWLYGLPYPDIDYKNDPDAGIKFMHNKKVTECRPPTLDQPANTIWVGENGYERDFHLRWRRLYFWARPGGEVPNPGKTKSFELTQLLLPYDLAGMVILTDSPLDGKGDKQYVYVPAIRRIKKQSGAARSDPSFGSDFVSDDAAGWGGQAETMDWKVVETRIALVPVEGWLADHPDVYVKQSDNSWKTQRNIPLIAFPWNDKSGNYPKGVAQWCPTSAVWVPREVVVLEATPLDPYYNYGKCVYWLDKQNFACPFKIVRNKAGEYWKTLLVNAIAQDWGDETVSDRYPGPYRTFGLNTWYVIIDDRSHHASVSQPRGEIVHTYSDHIIMGPEVKLEMMRPEYIPTMSK